MIPWKKLEDDLKIDGCSRCVMLGEMQTRLNSSHNRIRTKKISAVGRKMEMVFGHGKEWRRLRILHPDKQLKLILRKGTTTMTMTTSIMIHLHILHQVHLLLRLHHRLHHRVFLRLDLPCCQDLLSRGILWDP